MKLDDAGHPIHHPNALTRMSGYHSSERVRLNLPPMNGHTLTREEYREWEKRVDEDAPDVVT